jgi:hypothetical protein
MHTPKYCLEQAAKTLKAAQDQIARLRSAEMNHAERIARIAATMAGAWSQLARDSAAAGPATTMSQRAGAPFPGTSQIPAHPFHAPDGPAPCPRCQLLRDNLDWMEAACGPLPLLADDERPA